jgi:hypothetical protein
VWVPPDAPQLAWYLSDLRMAESRDGATLIVEPVPANAPAGASDTHRFALEESWTAKPSALTVPGALRYLFDLRPWTQDVEFRDVQLATNVPGTAMPSPSVAPSPAASATPPSVANPGASASGAPLPTPTASPTPSASSTAAEASPSTSPTPESPAPSATPHAANL